MGKFGHFCIITRTMPGAQMTAQKIIEYNYEPIILPAALLNPTNAHIETQNIQALLVTSSNAPRLAQLNDEIRALPVYAVGDATAKAANDAGFVNVVSAGGDASTLAVLAADRLKPKGGALMHLRGHEVAGDVSGLLKACGFEVKSTEIYQTIDNPEFSGKINEILQNNDGIILFHSPKGAQRFAKYANFAHLHQWSAVCISNGASIPIDEPVWKKFLIANRPNETSMLELI
jgi:uroporphyrinogen-III synthase